MKKTAKLFLIGSVATFGLSLTGPGGDILFGFLKPLGALLFGAFFITNLLANEYAIYDQEQKLKPVHSGATDAKPMRKSVERLEDRGLLAQAAAK